MGAKNYFRRSFSYFSRLAAGSLRAGWRALPLLFHGLDNVKVAKEFECKLNNGSHKKPALGLLDYATAPFGDYRRVLGAVPRLAGHKLHAHRERVRGIYREVLDITDARTPARRFLRAGSAARRLQVMIVRQRFQRELALNLPETTASILAGYSEASELLRDFLDFCHAVKCTETPEQMFSVVPAFVQVAKRDLGSSRLPRRDSFKDFQFESSTWLGRFAPSYAQLRGNSLNPSAVIVGIYDRREAMRRVTAERVGAVVRPALEAHLKELDRFALSTVGAVLAMEMHMQGCCRVIELAAEIPLGPRDSELLARALSELKQNLLRRLGTDVGNGRAAQSVKSFPER